MNTFTSQKVLRFYRLFRPEQTKGSTPPYKRILLCNQGGVGDVYLSTCIIPALRKAFPNCEIGMLVSPEGKAAVKEADYLHVHPYWFRLNEPKIFLYLRFLSFILFQKKKIAKELARKSYDCALIMNPYFSGGAHLAYTAGIPSRVGFETIGDREFLTQKIAWKEGLYLLERYKSLLEQIGAKGKEFFFSSPERGENRGRVIFHMFSADPRKDLPSSFWKDLHQDFCARGYEVYFTGKGKDQEREIAKITTERYNLCNKLDWEEFMEQIQSGSLIVSVDTAAVHLAAAAGKPFVAIYRHTPHFDLWYPSSKNGRALHWPVDVKQVFQEVENESRR